MKLISGGQTGVDYKGLEVAKRYGISTGGTAPKGYKTDEGQNLDLRDLYGLGESTSSDYKPRTIQNVQDSTVTIWFGDAKSPGGKCTYNACCNQKKQFISNPTIDYLMENIESLGGVWNIAGNRLRTNPQATKVCDYVLSEVFKRLGYQEA